MFDDYQLKLAKTAADLLNDLYEKKGKQGLSLFLEDVEMKSGIQALETLQELIIDRLENGEWKRGT